MSSEKQQPTTQKSKHTNLECFPEPEKKHTRSSYSHSLNLSHAKKSNNETIFTLNFLSKPVQNKSSDCKYCFCDPNEKKNK